MMDMKAFWKKLKSKTLRKSKDTKLYLLMRLRQLTEFLGNIPVDFVFVFLASFILTFDYALWERLFFSIGLTYITYKAKALFMIYMSFRGIKS